MKSRLLQARVSAYTLSFQQCCSGLVAVGHMQTYWTHLLDIVVAQCTAIFKLLAGEDQALLVWWDAFLVLDLALHIVDGVAGLDLEGDGLAREGLHEAVCYLLVGARRCLSHAVGAYICICSACQ